MKNIARRWGNRVLRWSLGGILIVASVGLPGTRLGSAKIMHPNSFAKSIRTYRMVPESLVLPMAMYMPWLELTTGIALILGIWQRHSLITSMLLCASFMIANTAALVRGLKVDCGCFGSGYHGTATRELLIALGMLAIAATALCLSPRVRPEPLHPTSNPSDPALRNHATETLSRPSPCPPADP